MFLLFSTSFSYESKETLDSNSIKTFSNKEIIWNEPQWSNHEQQDPNLSFDKRSDRHKKTVQKIEQMMKDNKIISDPNVGDRLLWGLDDDLTRIYYLQIMLERGDIVTKIGALIMTYFVNKFEDQYPLVYTDLNDCDHVITKKWFIQYIKSLIEIQDSSIQVRACATLVDLGYVDNQIISILKYYAKGTDIESWNIENNLVFRYEYSNLVNRDKSYENSETKELVTKKSKEALRLYSVSSLIIIDKYSPSEDIKNLLKDLLNTEITEKLINRIKHYLEDNN
jgi:hypothetical protein